MTKAPVLAEASVFLGRVLLWRPTLQRVSDLVHVFLRDRYRLLTSGLA